MNKTRILIAIGVAVLLALFASVGAYKLSFRSRSHGGTGQAPDGGHRRRRSWTSLSHPRSTRTR